MLASRTRRWLAICCIAGGAACGSHAATPAVPSARPAVAATEPAAGPAVARAAERVVAPSPAVEAVVAPPPAEPVVVLPPCLADPSRDDYQKPDYVVQLVEVSDAMTVVDLGSGSGYFLCRLSRAVGSRGHVIATEVTKQLVGELKQRVAREQLANTDVVLAPTHDVGVAPGSADRILVVNVWHHLGDRKRYAARIARALRPGGKLIVIDFKPSGSGHGIAPERVLAELAAGGIDGALIPEDLSTQYVIVGSVRRPVTAAREP